MKKAWQEAQQEAQKAVLAVIGWAWPDAASRLPGHAVAEPTVPNELRAYMDALEAENATLTEDVEQLKSWRRKMLAASLETSVLRIELNTMLSTAHLGKHFMQGAIDEIKDLKAENAALRASQVAKEPESEGITFEQWWKDCSSFVLKYLTRQEGCRAAWNASRASQGAGKDGK